MLQFNKNYFLLTVILFLTEIFIAVFVHDKLIRPYVGDVLVVILIYCFLKSFFKVPVVTTALSVLAFAYLVETLQYLNFVEYLGLQDNKIATIIIGNSFEWMDIVAYTAGIFIVIVVEKMRSNSADEKSLK